MMKNIRKIIIYWIELRYGQIPHSKWPTAAKHWLIFQLSFVTAFADPRQTMQHEQHSRPTIEHSPHAFSQINKRHFATVIDCMPSRSLSSWYDTATVDQRTKQPAEEQKVGGHFLETMSRSSMTIKNGFHSHFVAKNDFTYNRRSRGYLFGIRAMLEQSITSHSLK